MTDVELDMGSAAESITAGLGVGVVTRDALKSLVQELITSSPTAAMGPR
jgi:hypothetical protein